MPFPSLRAPAHQCDAWDTARSAPCVSALAGLNCTTPQSAPPQNETQLHVPAVQMPLRLQSSSVVQLAAAATVAVVSTAVMTVGRRRGGGIATCRRVRRLG